VAANVFEAMDNRLALDGRGSVGKNQQKVSGKTGKVLYTTELDLQV
jgi:hypothetical protein